MIVCPKCGRRSSDHLFCSWCRASLAASAGLPRQVVLADGQQLDCGGFHGRFPEEPWQPLHVMLGEVPLRVYAFSPEWWTRFAEVLEQRAVLSLDVLAPVELVPIPTGGAVLVAHGLPGGLPLLERAFSPNESVRLEELLAACRLLERALTPLHEAGLVWLNFGPAGLLVAGDRLEISSLDYCLFPVGALPLGFHPPRKYAPPELSAEQAGRISQTTDTYYVALYAYYQLAGLFPHGFPGEGLPSFDFDLPSLRTYAPTLPPGIAPVIMRGLAADPLQRFATVRLFVAALASAMERVQARWADVRAITVEAAAATAIGTSHVLMNLPNQDAHAIVQHPDGVVAMVADGVTLTRIGSGERASELAVEVLSKRVTSQATEQQIIDACLEATAVILEEALRQVSPGEPFDPCELMSTTIVLAVIRGNEMIVACGGDSRAYLISEGEVEQLTVDGDVRCVHLAAGWSPEQMNDLGADSFALYHCLGLGEPDASGRLVPCEERCTPRIRRWKLRPGDVVILCSDGLVEEGVYLEPAELALFAAEREAAADLANALVAAAISRHRGASPWEPYGLGDDVTCVVLRMREG